VGFKKIAKIHIDWNATHTKIFYLEKTIYSMEDLSTNDKLTLLQYAISKYEEENILMEKLKTLFNQKDIDRGIATLIGTQKVRRIGPDILQNNISHTGELPELSPKLKSIIDNL